MRVDCIIKPTGLHDTGMCLETTDLMGNSIDTAQTAPHYHRNYTRRSKIICALRKVNFQR